MPWSCSLRVEVVTGHDGRPWVGSEVAKLPRLFLFLCLFLSVPSSLWVFMFQSKEPKWRDGSFTPDQHTSASSLTTSLFCPFYS